jgi:hypothetical protein
MNSRDWIFFSFFFFSFFLSRFLLTFSNWAFLCTDLWFFYLINSDKSGFFPPKWCKQPSFITDLISEKTLVENKTEKPTEAETRLPGLHGLQSACDSGSLLKEISLNVWWCFDGGPCAVLQWGPVSVSHNKQGHRKWSYSVNNYTIE